MISPILISAAQLRGLLVSPLDRDMVLRPEGLLEMVRLGKSVHISTHTWDHEFEFKDLNQAKYFFKSTYQILLGPVKKKEA